MSPRCAPRTQAGARGYFARLEARKLRDTRLQAESTLEAAIAMGDAAVLHEAIVAAQEARVEICQNGAELVAEAERLLAKLYAEMEARRAAAAELAAALEEQPPSATLHAVLMKATLVGVDRSLLERGERRWKTLREEEQRRREEETRRCQEEARLEALAAAEKAAAQKQLLAERRQREEAERRRAAAAEAEERKLLERDECERAEAGRRADAVAAAAEQGPEFKAEDEDVAQRAFEEEEALRERVLEQLERRGVKYESPTGDVLEYAVYLGMQLPEDTNLLWIADRALQADDPEGWEQCESPNGDVYYVHEVTRQVMWQHPLDYQYQQMYLEERKIALRGRFEPDGRSMSPAASSSARPTESPSTTLAGKAMPTVSDDQLRKILHQVLGIRHSDLRSLLTQPACCTERVRCYVMRHKSRMGGSRFDFWMNISRADDMYCFTAKKHSVAKGCYYSISLDQDEAKRSKTGESESFIGKV